MSALIKMMPPVNKLLITRALNSPNAPENTIHYSQARAHTQPVEARVPCTHSLYMHVYV
jgi:hypothetical protein